MTLIFSINNFVRICVSFSEYFHIYLCSIPILKRNKNIFLELYNSFIVIVPYFVWINFRDYLFIVDINEIDTIMNTIIGCGITARTCKNTNANIKFYFNPFYVS